MPEAHLQANEGGADAKEVQGLVGEQSAGDAVLLDSRIVNNHLLGRPVATACCSELDRAFWQSQASCSLLLPASQNVVTIMQQPGGSERVWQGSKPVTKHARLKHANLCHVDQRSLCNGGSLT